MSNVHGDDIQKFTAAVKALNTGDYARNLALGSLLASVQGRPEYEIAAREALAPRAGELELHLDGEEIVGHSANAAAFGTLVKRLADGVKIIARDSMGLARMSSDLIVEPGPGSVRVIFRAPDPVPSDAIDGADDAGLWSDPNQQAIALRQVANLLASAEPGSEGAAAVDSMVEQLPPKARPALVSAMSSINSQEWEVEGEFRQRDLGVQQFTVSRAGAARLKTALKVKQRQKSHLTVSGRFDGHRRARSLSWFIPDTGREITALVPSIELMNDVAGFDQDESQRVIADFTVLTTHGPGSGDAGTRSYILDSLRAATSPDTVLDFGDDVRTA